MNPDKPKLLLVVVAKAPVAGQVKTRLHSELTPAEATALYRCFIQDRITEIGQLKTIDLAISFTPADSKNYFTSFTANGFHLFAQRGKDLGQRLSNIFVDKLAAGYDAVSIIDSDTPDLPHSIVQQSFQILATDRTDAVFGPCDDGGYYLVGLRRPHPQLFQQIPWSTDRVLPQTLEMANTLGLQTKFLPPWNDLDTFQDLLDYYQQYRDKPLASPWPGKKTFRFLANMKRITKPERSPYCHVPQRS
jgi:rSAM/selenodomain-associated transferase 1